MAVDDVARKEGPAIEALDLVKRFGDFAAVDGITFTVNQGETYSILGPNGAGKSSTMKMVTTVSPPTSGHLSVLGLDPATEGRTIRSRLGVVPQEDILDEALSVKENLVAYGRYFGFPRSHCQQRAGELLNFVQLTEKADAKVNNLSGGMKRRLSIARALINEPDLILLDEPTTGLDPQARHLLWERLYQLKEQGVTLLLTTHYMDEAEQLADRLVIMDHGKIAVEGSPAELIATHSPREVLELRFGDTLVEARQELDDTLPHLRVDTRLEHLPDRSLIYVDDGDGLLDALRQSGVRPAASMVRRSTLEDVFLRLTGRRLDD